MEEAGVNEAMRSTGRNFNKGYSYASDSVSQAVEANPAMKSARDSTTKAMANVSQSVSSFFGGWGYGGSKKK